MKIVTLASSSKGNCIYIETSKTKILVDAGIPVSKIVDSLGKIGVMPEDIDSIVVSHEHIDHAKSVGKFSKKYNSEIFVSAKTYRALVDKKYISPNNNKIYIFEDIFYLKDLVVESFEVPHDAKDCRAFNFYNSQNKISIVTDLGHFNKKIIELIRGSSLVILESNYDEDLILQNYKYPERLKSRIRGNKGHLSNIDAAELIYNLIGLGLKQVILAHLSEENNRPERAYTTIKEILKNRGITEGEHVFIDVAPVCAPGNIYKIS